ncbi:hypothetical protein BC937DRAFT_92193, partial [Endogone sp. FLAS-F59071]
FFFFLFFFRKTIDYIPSGIVLLLSSVFQVDAFALIYKHRLFSLIIESFTRTTHSSPLIQFKNFMSATSLCMLTYIFVITLCGPTLALPSPPTIDKRDLFAWFARPPECPSCANWHPFTGENDNAYPAEASPAIAATALAEEPKIDVNNLNNVQFVSSFPLGVTPITLYMTNTSPLQISEQTTLQSAVDSALQAQLSSSASEPGITESPVEATATEPMSTEQPSVKTFPSSSVNTDVAISRRDKSSDTPPQVFSKVVPSSATEASVAALDGFSASAPQSSVEASPLSESQFLVTELQSLGKLTVPAVSGAGCENPAAGMCEFHPKPTSPSKKYVTIPIKHVVGSFSSNGM